MPASVGFDACLEKNPSLCSRVRRRPGSDRQPRQSREGPRHARSSCTSEDPASDPRSVGRSPSGYLLQRLCGRRGERFETPPHLGRRDVVWALQRRFLGYVHASLDTVGHATERDDRALEPARQVQHQRQRVWKRDHVRGRWCGRHLHGLSLGQVNVRQLQESARPWHLERSQEVLNS
jgi:hypothetical protein